MDKSFAEYRDDAHSWITLATGEFYPDILPLAQELYKPVLVTFGQILKKSHSSKNLFEGINEISETWMRVQLCRVFRKYVSPATPVEMLKQKRKAPDIIHQFGDSFRPINEVAAAFASRPLDDEALSAVLWEYKDRGKSGYDLTQQAFTIIRENLGEYVASGPERAGRDIILGELFTNYPKPDRPIDLLIKDSDGNVAAIGLARYDGDRGGAQEDDRTGQYREVADELIRYFDSAGLPKAKVFFINDGPGLLLGSMWSDYSHIDEMHEGRVRVMTLRMIPIRLTSEWLQD